MDVGTCSRDFSSDLTLTFESFDFLRPRVNV